MEQYNKMVANGDIVCLTKPISDLECDMVEKYNIKYLEFVEWVDNGYARCRDLDIGALWIVHPESLIFSKELENISIQNAGDWNVILEKTQEDKIAATIVHKDGSTVEDMGADIGNDNEYGSRFTTLNIENNYRDSQNIQYAPETVNFEFGTWQGYLAQDEDGHLTFIVKEDPECEPYVNWVTGLNGRCPKFEVALERNQTPDFHVAG